MVTTPTTDAEAFQSLDSLRERVDYDGDELFRDNEQLRFDQLLARLERESRDIFITLWGDQPPTAEDGRIDTKRTTDDSAIMLPYPVRDVTEVEVKHSLDSDWETLDSDWYDFTPHRLILARTSISDRVRRGNPIAETARRATWRDIGVKIRVTYDRGFENIPYDIQSIQVVLVNRMLRHLRHEQNLANMSADEFEGLSPNVDDVVSEDIRQRIQDVTKPSGATLSV
jgi:hypothetical protein